MAVTRGEEADELVLGETTITSFVVGVRSMRISSSLVVTSPLSDDAGDTTVASLRSDSGESGEARGSSQSIGSRQRQWNVLHRVSRHENLTKPFILDERSVIR